MSKQQMCDRAVGDLGPLSSSSSLLDSLYLVFEGATRGPLNDYPSSWVSDTPGNKMELSEKIVGISLIVKHRDSLESLQSDIYPYEKFYDSELPVRMFKQPPRVSNSALIVITHH